MLIQDLNCIFISEPVKPLIEKPEDPRHIPVGDGSPVTLNVGHNITSLVDTPLKITCPASGVPMPVITWSKNGQPLAQSERISVDETGALSIAGSLISDAGRYTCTVKNRGGEDSVSTQVDVTGKR